MYVLCDRGETGRGRASSEASIDVLDMWMSLGYSVNVDDRFQIIYHATSGYLAFLMLVAETSFCCECSEMS